MPPVPVAAVTHDSTHPPTRLEWHIRIQHLSARCRRLSGGGSCRQCNSSCPSRQARPGDRGKVPSDPRRSRDTSLRAASGRRGRSCRGGPRGEARVEGGDARRTAEGRADGQRAERSRSSWRGCGFVRSSRAWDLSHSSPSRLHAVWPRVIRFWEFSIFHPFSYGSCPARHDFRYAGGRSEVVEALGRRASRVPRRRLIPTRRIRNPDGICVHSPGRLWRRIGSNA